MDFDLKQFNNVKKEAEENYKIVGEIFCLYLKGKVSFNAKGLDHIKFKEWNKPRLISEQYLRLKLLKLAPQIVEKS
ncbi:MAG: hypothetical protein V1770_05745 [bacterium]